MALDVYEAKEVELGDETMRKAEKQIMLWAVDSRWVRHLTDLDRLREGIGLQALAQVDPLVAYKRQAFNMYGELMNDISRRHRQGRLHHPGQTAGRRCRHPHRTQHPHQPRFGGRQRHAANRAQDRSPNWPQRSLLVR